MLGPISRAVKITLGDISVRHQVLAQANIRGRKILAGR